MFSVRQVALEKERAVVRQALAAIQAREADANRLHAQLESDRAELQRAQTDFQVWASSHCLTHSSFAPL
jgi:hypothetical protein